MNLTNTEQRAIYLKERNQKLASNLVLIITIFEKIERLKQKLCGFSPTQFSPESIFEALDLTGKGYLDTYDIHSFLGNDSIRDKDILILFSRLGDQGLGRLTYLGYLALLKPFFDYQLARDLLLRDTVAHKSRRAGQNDDNLHQMQQTVLILLNELILLHCICIAEHQTMKSALMQEYMLNQIEIKQILGLGGKIGSLTAIHEFIQCNSEYDVDKSQIKYLLAFIQSNQISLSQEKCINMLFMPTRPVQKKLKKQAQDQRKSIQRESLHANYTKDFLGKGDLIVTSSKLSFLNYIHPNSFQKPVNDKNTLVKTQEKHQTSQDEQVEQQHKKLNISPERLVSRPFKPESRVPTKERQITESFVERSNLHQMKRPESSRLQPYSYDRIDTPVLQQFMHQSNIRRNMGNFKDSNRETELKVLIEESSVSESDGIVRVDTTSKQGKHRIANFIPPQPKRQEEYEINIKRPNFANNNSSNAYSQYFQQKNRSALSNAGETSGILNQFLKSEFR